MITRPTPALKPVSTGSEMRLATTPRRNKPANSRNAPTRNDKVADAVSSAAGPSPEATWPRMLTAMIDMVEEGVTLRGRDVRNTAYTTSGKSEASHHTD